MTGERDNETRSLLSTTPDPLAGASWSNPGVVAGFTSSPPNDRLMWFAENELRHARTRRALDLGCGAGRNAVPLAEQGWDVLGVELSVPMVEAAARRAHASQAGQRLCLALAPMDNLPVAARSCELIIAHGIWNLARSSAEFRNAIREAARVATPGAGLFVFTFSRSTLPVQTKPVSGEPFVFTEFSGDPQCFLTEDQLVGELADAGFAIDPAIPLRELNRRNSGALVMETAPVIFEGTFRYRS
jgi:SAM-dependent methyltransferase